MLPLQAAALHRHHAMLWVQAACWPPPCSVLLPRRLLLCATCRVATALRRADARAVRRTLQLSAPGTRRQCAVRVARTAAVAWAQ
eukprot:4542275-Alexandrium_andersonii.AAC.1